MFKLEIIFFKFSFFFQNLKYAQIRKMFKLQKILQKIKSEHFYISKNSNLNICKSLFVLKRYNYP
jgi:hypothetical protein